MSDYVAGHVQEALAHAGETDVHVRVVSGRLLLTGTVTTAARRDAVSSIARDVAGDLDVRNEVSVLLPREPDGEQEQLS